MSSKLILDRAYVDGNLAFERGFPSSFVPDVVRANGRAAVRAFHRGYAAARAEAQDGETWGAVALAA